MQREEVPPGRAVVTEGDSAERFYIVLSGLFSVSQQELGPRRVLQPGHGAQRQLVRGFGIHPEKEGAGEGVGQQGHPIIPGSGFKPGIVRDAG